MSMFKCLFICDNVRTREFMYECWCAHVCVHVCIHVCSTDVYVYVFMHESVYVVMFACVCMYTWNVMYLLYFTLQVCAVAYV